jgi:hypothetical protein
LAFDDFLYMHRVIDNSIKEVKGEEEESEDF